MSESRPITLGGKRQFFCRISIRVSHPDPRESGGAAASPSSLLVRASQRDGFVRQRHETGAVSATVVEKLDTLLSHSLVRSRGSERRTNEAPRCCRPRRIFVGPCGGPSVRKAISRRRVTVDAREVELFAVSRLDVDVERYDVVAGIELAPDRRLLLLAGDRSPSLEPRRPPIRVMRPACSAARVGIVAGLVDLNAARGSGQECCRFRHRGTAGSTPACATEAGRGRQEASRDA